MTQITGFLDLPRQTKLDNLLTIKIIALVNQLSDSEPAALLQKGFDGCISNPADVTEVVNRIEETTAIIY